MEQPVLPSHRQGADGHCALGRSPRNAWTSPDAHTPRASKGDGTCLRYGASPRFAPPGTERSGSVVDCGRVPRDGAELPLRIATLHELLLVAPRIRRCESIPAESESKRLGGLRRFQLRNLVREENFGKSRAPKLDKELHQRLCRILARRVNDFSKTAHIVM